MIVLILPSFCINPARFWHHHTNILFPAGKATSKRRRNDVETTSEHVVESTSKSGWKRKWSRRWDIDVVSTYSNRRRFDVGISTSFPRYVFDVVSTSNNSWKRKWNRRWNVDVISTYMFRPKFDAKMNAPAFLNYKCLISYEKHSCCNFSWNIYSHIYIIGLDTDNYDTITLNLHDYTLVTYA